MNQAIRLLFCAIFIQFALPSMASGRLEIYWMDVEGGAATLIVTPQRESVLIDTGSAGGRDAARIHKTATELAGLSKIDHLIITHFHSDHFGGAAELAKLIPIGELYDKGVPEHDPDHNPDDKDFLKRIQPYKQMSVGSHSRIYPGFEIPLKSPPDSSPLHFSLRCIAVSQLIDKNKPNPSKSGCDCPDLESRPVDTSDNINSVVMLLEYGPFRFFDGGDLTWNMEGRLVCPVNLVGTVDVFQVDHHGLDLSNNPLLVRSLRPTVSVMSNGTTKGCGRGTFATLQSTISIEAMYQIHKNLRADSTNNTSDDCIANLEKACAGNCIKLSLAEDGRSYEVSIPATGYKRSFNTKPH